LRRKFSIAMSHARRACAKRGTKQRQVDGDSPCPLVEADESRNRAQDQGTASARPCNARRHAARLLDLLIGPEVGQEHRGEWRRRRVAEVGHADAGERTLVLRTLGSMAHALPSVS
jgi:hypothetical protein